MPTEPRPMRDIIATAIDDTVLGGEGRSVSQRAADAEEALLASWNSGIRLPDECPVPVFEILSFMCFQLGPLAHAYRIGGHDIRRKAEDEQAFMLWRFLKAYETHGPGWHGEIDRQLEEMRDAAAAKEAAS